MAATGHQPEDNSWPRAVGSARSGQRKPRSVEIGAFSLLVVSVILSGCADTQQYDLSALPSTRLAEILAYNHHYGKIFRVTGKYSKEQILKIPIFKPYTSKR